ncbi:MAG TPA: hypothetical protein VNO14_08825 [Blastocatellia bacterium]|nr:hypothetical protein [Blastocatellia bacterium]
MRAEDSQSGYSLIDVMIAIAILLVGILALVSAVTGAVVKTTESQEALTAKQYASSTVEAIFAARDLETLGWDVIGNVGDPQIPGGVFVTGVNDIWPSPGIDGIVGTADDQAGPDGQLGNADDGTPVFGFRRQISVRDIPDPDRPGAPITLRQIDVTIFYRVGSNSRQETFTSYIANYRTR